MLLGERDHPCVEAVDSSIHTGQDEGRPSRRRRLSTALRTESSLCMAALTRFTAWRTVV
jgi:hypothetical protein